MASVLAVVWMAIVMVGHGYVNLVEWLALALHRHARSVARMHRNRAQIIEGRWRKEMEETA
jgi:hypothetical protein